MKTIRVFLFSILSLIAYGQEEDNRKKIIFIAPNYELQFPFGDMKDDFGINSNVGLELCMITAKNGFAAFHISQLFGNNVKDTTILNHLMDENLNIFDENGQIADILLLERGYNIQFKTGFLFPVKNRQSGILTYGTFGYHQHRIKIDIKNDNVPQLNEDYKKMYDQMVAGLSASLFLGYLNVNQPDGIHFYGGIEFGRSFSKNQRSYNYISKGPIEGLRNDLFLGLKIGWIIAISKRNTREFYYF